MTHDSFAKAFYAYIKTLKGGSQYWKFIESVAKEAGVEGLIPFKRFNKRSKKLICQKARKPPEDNGKNPSSGDEQVNQSDEDFDDKTCFEFNSIEIKKRITSVMFVVF